MKKWIVSFFLFLCLSALGQAGSEILLFDCKVVKGQVFLSRGINITNHKGYDNQPSFHPSKPVIFYSSFNDSGRSDIKFYDYEKHETKNLTVTEEREYSPTITPDGQSISCIIQRDNGAQDLGKYPINGGYAEILINDLKIGYHSWAGNDKLFLFVLGDSNTNMLHYYNMNNKADTIIATNIGRSLHKIPGQHAMSFVQKISDKESLIKKYDLSTGAVTTIIPSLPGQDHLTWLQNNTILMSDGKDLFSYRMGSDTTWQPVIVAGDYRLPKGITRLAANNGNTRLAVVVSE